MGSYHFHPSPPWPLGDKPYPVWLLPPPVDHSPPSALHTAAIVTPVVVAVFAVLGSVFLLVRYYRIVSRHCGRWRGIPRLWPRHHPAVTREDQLRLEADETWMVRTTGLEEEVVRQIPVFPYRKGEGMTESAVCVVCLTEFKEEECLRMLPKCSHAFHLPCVDMWLKTHSNCPLCRANVKETDHPPLLLPGDADDGAMLEMEMEIEMVDEDPDQGGSFVASLNEASATVEDPMGDDSGGSARRWNSGTTNRIVDEKERILEKEILDLDMVTLRRSYSTGCHLSFLFVDSSDGDGNLSQRPTITEVAAHRISSASSEFRRSFSTSCVAIDIFDAAASTSSSAAALSPSQDLEKTQGSKLAYPWLSAIDPPPARSFLATTFSGRRVFPFWINNNPPSISDTSVARQQL